MNRIIVILLIVVTVFSCQKVENKKKNWPVASEKTEVAINDSVIDNNTKEVTIKLPNNSYAIVTLTPDQYTDNDIPDALKVDLYKPISVKIFDLKTKKELQNVSLDGVYYSESDDNISIGDFNFDGKIDVVCLARALSYRDFYSFNIFLATENGYQLNKDFSEITDVPLAYMKLDAKNKRITAVREAEWDETWLYQVSNNKLILIHNKSSSRSFDDEYDYSTSNDSIK